MLFIPDSDTGYDNVYWITTDNHVYKTDVGGKTIKSEFKIEYKEQTIDTASVIPGETLQAG